MGCYVASWPKAWVSMLKQLTTSEKEMVGNPGSIIVGAEATEAGEEERQVDQLVGAGRIVEAAAALPALLPVLEGRVSGQENLQNFRNQTQTRGRTHIPLAGP